VDWSIHQCHLMFVIKLAVVNDQLIMLPGMLTRQACARPRPTLTVQPKVLIKINQSEYFTFLLFVYFKNINFQRAMHVIGNIQYKFTVASTYVKASNPRQRPGTWPRSKICS